MKERIKFVRFNDDCENIPDSKNLNTCLECEREECDGRCEKISKKKGRAKLKYKYAR